jgi:hypothetical protein
MKEIPLKLALAACPLGMLTMGAFAWFSGKFLANRKKSASQPAGAEQPAPRG